jgi:hypothetical protein
MWQTKSAFHDDLSAALRLVSSLQSLQHTKETDRAKPELF